MVDGWEGECIAHSRWEGTCAARAAAGRPTELWSGACVVRSESGAQWARAGFRDGSFCCEWKEPGRDESACGALWAAPRLALSQVPAPSKDRWDVRLIGRNVPRVRQDPQAACCRRATTTRRRRSKTTSAASRFHLAAATDERSIHLARTIFAHVAKYAGELPGVCRRCGRSAP